MRSRFFPLQFILLFIFASTATGLLWAAPEGKTGRGLTVVISINSNIACFGGSEGSLTATAFGGAGNYQFLWSTGSTASTINNLTVGTYTVVAVDQQGITGTAMTVLNAPPALFASATAVPPLTCSNPSAEISIAASGGTPPYFYAWSNGSSNPSIIVNTQGTYFCTVSDVNGCTYEAQSLVAANNTTPTCSAGPIQTLTCAAPQVQLQGSGSSGPSYSVIWTTTNGNIVSGSTTYSPTIDQCATYTLTVTNQSNGCTCASSVVVVCDYTPPIAAIAPFNFPNPPFPATLSGAGSSTGTSYNYIWATTNGLIISGANTLTPVIATPGIYCLEVTNTNNGCTDTECITVPNPPAGLTVNIAVNSTIACNGAATGSLTASASGGAGGYQYLWSNGVLAPTINGLAAGTYTVVAVDAAGITGTATVTLTQPTLLIPNASSTNETGLGDNDGTATAAPTGGVSPYAFSWSTGATTQTIENLAPGAYTVVVTDANGCTAAQQVTVTAYVCAVTSVAGSTSVTCFGANNGTATITLTGATAPIVYQWSNGGFTATINNLSAGTYTVLATDSGNCTATASVTVSEPALLEAVATSTPETAPEANNGTASASVSGGTTPYTYIWSNGANTAAIANLTPGVYSVTVTDANGCSTTQITPVNAFECQIALVYTVLSPTCAGLTNGAISLTSSGGTGNYAYLWSNGVTTSSTTNIGAGNYGATVTDAVGCGAMVAINVTEPNPLTTEVVEVQNVVCLDDQYGAVSIVVSGGTTPYAYQWPLPGNGMYGVGLYALSITDFNGCTTTQDFSITNIDTVAPTIQCPVSFAECDFGFGVEYNYPTVDDNCSAGFPELIAGIAPGLFFPQGTTTNVFQTTDNAGNTATCAFNVTLYPLPDALLVSITDDQDSTGQGAINISPVGGTPPYTFAWYFNGQPFANTEDLSGLYAGAYTLELSDANGCSVNAAPFFINNTVGAFESAHTQSLIVSPNPTQSVVFMQLDGISAQSLQIFDRKGRLVDQKTKGEIGQRLDISAWPAGLYQLVLQGENGAYYLARLIKI